MQQYIHLSIVLVKEDTCSLKIHNCIQKCHYFAKILFFLLVSSFCFFSNTELSACNPEVLWMHLTAQHDWLSICSWIEESEPNQTLRGQANWPALTADIVDRNTLCSGYMRNDILNKLARYVLLTCYTCFLSYVKPK